MTLDTQIQTILKHIRANENGVTADEMRSHGLHYEHQFGVSIVRLRQIAKTYQADAKLAQTLWQKQWRETRILATTLMPPQDASEQICLLWISQADTVEMIEQLSFNLLANIDNIIQLLPQWLASDNADLILASSISLGHIVMRQKQLPTESIEPFLPILSQLSEASTARNRRGISLALRRIGRKNTELHKRSIAITDTISKTDNANCQWIAHDVRAELQDPYIIETINQ